MMMVAVSVDGLEPKKKTFFTSYIYKAVVLYTVCYLYRHV